MKVLSWNVNGLRAILKKGFVEWVLTENPDILCLQETKVDEEQIPDEARNINGYYSYFNSAEKKGYSGVAIYSKIKPNKVQKGFGIEDFDKEGRVLIAEYNDFVLYTIYYPNGASSKERLVYKMKFYDIFLNHCEKYKAENKKIAICGDINTAHKEIDLSRPKENSNTSGFLPIEREWMDKLVSYGYTDTFRYFDKSPEKYTWWDYKTRARERNIGWRIDYFFVSNNMLENIKNAYILNDVMGSDHCPVGIDIAF